MPGKLELLLTALVLAGCGSGPIDDKCGGACEPYGSKFPGVGECKDGACTPTFTECVERDVYDTCEQACAEQGRACVTNGCAESTYLIFSVLEWCEDPERTGVAIARECSEPIDWQVNSAARCCCSQE